MADSVVELHEGEQFLCPSACFLFRLFGDECRYHHVFESGKFRQQLMELEDKSYLLVSEVGEFVIRQGVCLNSVDDHLSRVRLVECSDNLQQGGFPGSAWSDDTDDFSFPNVQVDAFKHLE